MNEYLSIQAGTKSAPIVTQTPPVVLTSPPVTHKTNTLAKKAFTLLAILAITVAGWVFTYFTLRFPERFSDNFRVALGLSTIGGLVGLSGLMLLFSELSRYTQGE